MKVVLLVAFFAISASAAPIAGAGTSRRAALFTSSRFSVNVGAAVLPLSLHSAPKEDSTLSTVKDTADTAKSIAEIIGLAVGGFWTWMLFVKNRQDYPRAKIGHAISHRVLPNGSRLLRVRCTVANIGQVFLRLDSAFVWVQQMLPLPADFQAALDAGKDPLAVLGPSESEYAWPLAGDRKCDWAASPREIEPGEEDYIQFDFVVDGDAQLIEIYSYFKNERKKREIGWSETTIYDFLTGAVLPDLPIALQAAPKPTPPIKGTTTI
jgi:hypothetical protein